MLNKEKILENIIECFNDFNSSKDDYLGSVYISIYKELPFVYRLSFNNKRKLIYKFGYEKNNLIKEPINNYINERKLLINLYEHREELGIYVFNYSLSEYLIISTQDVPFIINIALSESSDCELMFEYVYTTDIEKTFEKISKYFEIINKNREVEFGIAAVDGTTNCLYTSWYDYKSKKCDIKKNYNDDIPYDRIKELLQSEDSNELLLFYGDPGTGKSTLIKHFISIMPEKDFIFIDGAMLANMQQEKIMSYFLENQNAIFILEDCERVLIDREHNFNPVMPLILNVTDGIIGDVLGIKLICTFNTSLNNIDKALLRKGRLSLKYEFKALDKEKVRKLLKDDSIDENMTLADLYNMKQENDYSKKQTRKIGF